MSSVHLTRNGKDIGLRKQLRRPVGYDAQGLFGSAARNVDPLEIRSMPVPPWRSGENLAREKALAPDPATLVTITVHSTSGYSHGA